MSVSESVRDRVIWGVKNGLIAALGLSLFLFLQARFVGSGSPLLKGDLALVGLYNICGAVVGAAVGICRPFMTTRPRAMGILFVVSVPLIFLALRLMGNGSDYLGALLLGFMYSGLAAPFLMFKESDLKGQRHGKSERKSRRQNRVDD